MIPFLRKIRKQLIDKNRIGGYLLYAIGEIALIIIGILLALQINSWNEGRKLARLEKSYYENLLWDFRQDSIEMEFKKRNAARNKAKLYNILSYIENGYDISQASITPVSWMRDVEYTDTLALIHSLSQAGFMQYPMVYFNTIEDLRSTGNIKLLKNQELKNRILRYYNSDKTLNTWIQALIPARSAIEAAINHVLTREERIAYTTEEGLNMSMVDPDRLEKAMRATEMQPLAVGMLHVQGRIILRANNVMGDIMEIMGMLRDEIEKMH